MSVAAIITIVVVVLILAAAILKMLHPKTIAPRLPVDPLGGRAALEIDYDGPCDFDIVGESHYQQELDKICGGKCVEGHRRATTALLVTEDDNPYDSQAVRVIIEGRQVGYLSRKHARQLRKRVARPEGFIIQVKAEVVGGWDSGDGDEGHYGVRLALPQQTDSEDVD